jgi:DNA polymerase-3 subunit gamma/tau
MGSVSNIVFEQILAAVHANNSADVLSILGRLLDAGNGPQPLARQFVRYLRNCTIAKITNLAPDQPAHGLAADLLQISPEERSRAARSAALFTEEELSRFLSILLRTFDDLGYRQEPRFHLELGVLKLVHLQRLLPVEDLLTQLGATKSPPTPSTTPTSTSPSSSSQPQASTSPAAPSTALSSRPEARSAAVERPLYSGTQATTPSASAKTSVILSEVAPAAQSKDPDGPRPSTAAPPFSTPAPTDGSLALAPETQPEPDRPHLVAKSPEPASALDIAALHSALIAALAAVKGQQTASDAIHDATFTLAPNIGPPDTLQVQTTLSKTMLPVVLNGEAERLLKAALRHAAPTLKLALLPGAPAANGAKKTARPAPVGSATELAEKHPMVQEAKRLFSAEISNVIDLRDKD